MTDPSSQNPSDPAKKPDSSVKKLKLKQLLTPLSPHLIVKPHEHPTPHNIDEFEPKMETPRAEAIEPEPELAPHERPPSLDGTPLPPNEVQLGPNGEPIPQPDQAHLNPMEMARPEESVQENAVEDQQEEEIEELVSAPAPKSNRFRKVALPVIAIMVVLAAVNYLFDPLGLSIEAIDQPTPVVVSAQQEVAGKDETPANMAPVALSLELENISVQSFLGQLERQSIIVINKPKGAIIDSVFYPEGSTLNPMLGLVLNTVQVSGKNSNIEIVDESGKRYELSAK